MADKELCLVYQKYQQSNLIYTKQEIRYANFSNFPSPHLFSSSKQYPFQQRKHLANEILSPKLHHEPQASYTKLNETSESQVHNIHIRKMATNLLKIHYIATKFLIKFTFLNITSEFINPSIKQINTRSSTIVFHL